MALRTWAVTALPILAARVVVGCGGQGDGETRATLTEDGCTYEGKETPAAKDDYGRFDIAVENRTLRFASFALARVARDVAFDEIGPMVESVRRHLRTAFHRPRCHRRPGTTSSEQRSSPNPAVYSRSISLLADTS